MLENMQDISLQSSHEAGVDALWLEFLNGFASFIKSIYECQKKGKDHKVERLIGWIVWRNLGKKTLLF
ncbi:hypothetical protein ACR9JN_03390 [Helicobacter pylori]|uniref:hypothetical protein n=1 Tax=Helicobacter pylori TaxID=210 RepID=UPI002712A947|nr:hypothetical protein [Helicobacter pylori]MDO7806807.1 hypothetical protein [Helicobacter pylori]